MGLPAFLYSSAISTDGRSMVPQQPGEIQSYQVPQYCCSGVCRVSGRSSIRSPQAGHWGISMRAVYFIAILPFHIHFIFPLYRARSKSARSWLQCCYNSSRGKAHSVRGWEQSGMGGIRRQGALWRARWEDRQRPMSSPCIFRFVGYLTTASSFCKCVFRW